MIDVGFGCRAAVVPVVAVAAVLVVVAAVAAVAVAVLPSPAVVPPVSFFHDLVGHRGRPYARLDAQRILNALHMFHNISF